MFSLGSTRILSYLLVALQLSGPQHTGEHQLVCPQGQDLTLLLAQPHQVLFDSFLWAVRIPLAGSRVIWCISHSFQFLSAAEKVTVTDRSESKSLNVKHIPTTVSSCRPSEKSCLWSWCLLFLCFDSLELIAQRDFRA